MITSEDVDVRALDAYARSTGETPDGMEWQSEQENDSFSIR